MHGYFGKFLYVNLSTDTLRDYAIPPDWYERHVGGRGLAARLLLEELPSSGDLDPFGPENILVLATGPLQGTGIVGAARHVVAGVSPKTGRAADSYAGGFFGHEIGHSGYDGILVRGVSAEPVVLTVIDGKPRLEPAGDLWGKGTGETEETLKERYPNARVSSIGVAGESLVSQACIINDRNRSAGRPGLGAVMGSKRLKAIVVRGALDRPIADPQRLAAERADYVKQFTDEATQEGWKYGTSGGVVALSEMGILPTKNFQEGVFDEAATIGGQTMYDTILVRPDTCIGCPIRCKRVVETTFEGRDVLPEFGGPEYETVAALGSLCMNADLHAIAMANQLCNDLGVDTISVGVGIAFLMEASERGLIDEPVRWGDASAVVRLTEEIAHRRGLGGRLSDGLDRLASELGADFAMTIKGVELPMHEPRGKQGMGLSYATTYRGANHMEGLHDTMLAMDAPCEELGVDRAYDRFTLTDKAPVGKTFEDLRSFDNSLVLCCFTTRSVGPRYGYAAVRSLLEAVTGRTIDAEEMLAIGERNYALMRLLSGRMGHRMAEDGLPARFAEALPRGASADHPVDPDEMRSTIADFYRARGFDETGPTAATLRRLGLDDCVRFLGA